MSEKTDDPKRETLQDSLRRRLRERLGMVVCPTCCRSGGVTVRDGARVSGIKLTSLHRFLSGKNADGKTLDAVAAFLEVAQ